MSTAETTRAEAVDNSWHVVTLRGVDWKTYCQLRDQEVNNHVRMSYLDGTLFLMSPQLVHDNSDRRLALIVDMVTWVHRIPHLGTATTTLRRKGDRPRKGSGKEPDYGFYFGDDALLIRNKEEIDLDVDPPPGLAIEVDNKADSSKALKLYARLGVPEVWRYKARTKTLWFGRLVGDHYEPTDRSLNLPRLTPALVVQALDEAGRLPELEWKDWLLAWARDLPEAPAIA
jgi:Uma2 family endonuclease